ncbi:hypothetical protein WJX84_000550 [Apatococcus fuscideae]|uniref:Uncharacterized protein n=1 Tax=Apatococcus fuscideae TaxID=2026836 RepID=A0AAW1SVW8_9CHLO
MTSWTVAAGIFLTGLFIFPLAFSPPVDNVFLFGARAARDGCLHLPLHLHPGGVSHIGAVVWAGLCQHVLEGGGRLGAVLCGLPGATAPRSVRRGVHGSGLLPGGSCSHVHPDRDAGRSLLVEMAVGDETSEGQEAGTNLLPFWQRGQQPPEQLQRKSPDPGSPFSGHSSKHSDSSPRWDETQDGRTMLLQDATRHDHGH